MEGRDVKADRPARALVAPIIKIDTPVPMAAFRVQPCPGCDLLALYKEPDEGFISCAGCGLVLDEQEYLDRFGADPDAGVTVPPSHRPVVYYMRLDAIVKIGFTTRLGRRLMDINPQGVLAVEWGARRLEGQRHNQFAEHHVHGEWFRFGAELAAHLIEVRAAFEADMGTTTESWLHEVSAGWWA